ncbi:MAG TPA: hypothetical protein VMT50_05860 [Steroidobacteraceae bacterium]|nr:hypothetical protein [Steroidobacteraceae bacterium]
MAGWPGRPLAGNAAPLAGKSLPPGGEDADGLVTGLLPTAIENTA